MSLKLHTKSNYDFTKYQFKMLAFHYGSIYCDVLLLLRVWFYTPCFCVFFSFSYDLHYQFSLNQITCSAARLGNLPTCRHAPRDGGSSRHIQGACLPELHLMISLLPWPSFRKLMFFSTWNRFKFDFSYLNSTQGLMYGGGTVTSFVLVY